MTKIERLRLIKKICNDVPSIKGIEKSIEYYEDLCKDKDFQNLMSNKNKKELEISEYLEDLSIESQKIFGETQEEINICIKNKTNTIFNDEETFE